MDEYYKLIYTYLMVDLKPDKICELMGLCGKKEDLPVAPLIPAELAVKIIPSSKLIGAEEAKVRSVFHYTINCVENMLGIYIDQSHGFKITWNTLGY